MQSGRLLLAIPGVGHAQPAGVDGAGRGHVEQAQIFLQPFAIGSFAVGLGDDQVERGAAVLLVQHEAVAGLRFARETDEGQQHQRVFQPLGLVDGDHLNQRRLAFQPHDLLVGRLRACLAGLGDLVGQMPQQRVFAIERGSGLLQQFGQVQQVGQRALAVVATQQLRGQLEAMQQLVQHRQHAMLQPELVQLAEALAHRLPAGFVAVEHVQRGVVLIQRGGGQGRTHRAIGARLGTGAQPQQQVGRLGRGEHRFAIGQIDAGQSARTQGLAHAGCFRTVAHQDGDVARHQRAQRMLAIIEPATAALRRVEQLHQPRRRVIGQLGLAGPLADRFKAGRACQLQCRHRLVVQ